MPDGLRLPQRADAWQARPNFGRWLRSATRSNTNHGSYFYARGCPTSAKKNPARALTLAGSISLVPLPAFACNGEPVAGLSLARQHRCPGGTP